MSESYVKNVVEAALLAAGKSLQVADIAALFAEDEASRPPQDDILSALQQLGEEYAQRALELKHTASGWRVQVRSDFAPEISRLWPERPSKYSRALLETLALIAYRQPITRGEIETVRGVAVNPNIIKTLLERNWVRVVGTRDVPGRPEILGTTKEFLDYFGLRSLDELPALAELKSENELNLQLQLSNQVTETAEAIAAGARIEGEAADAAAAKAEAAAATAPAATAAAEASSANADPDAEADDAEDLDEFDADEEEGADLEVTDSADEPEETEESARTSESSESGESGESGEDGATPSKAAGQAD